MRGQRPAWLDTPLGRVIRFFGGIRFAVPVLLLVAAALAWGTYLESTQDASTAGRLVYGSWWFISLMVLICISLTFAVVTRFPWRRKHIGFMIVHASMIAVIAASFFTYFTKIEGQLVLEEGQSSGWFRLDTRQVELLKHDEGAFVVEQSVETDGTDQIVLGELNMRIVDRWANTTHSLEVTNDGKNPLHAAEVSIDSGGPGEPMWIGQIASAAPAPALGPIAIRVLPAGETWQPPAGEPTRLMLRDSEGHAHAVPAVGETIHDDWTVVSLDHFAHAIVDEAGLREGEHSRDNPAVLLVMRHTDGSVEQHIAFEKFPGSPMKKQIEGHTFSSFILNHEGGGGLAAPTVAISRDGESVGAIIALPAQDVQTLEAPGDFPWSFEVGPMKLTIHRDYANARGEQAPIEARAGDENLPAVLVEYDDAGETRSATLVYGKPTAVALGGEIKMLRYAPTLGQLPFTVELVEFRKMDYPGSQMAMAYESDVIWTPDGGEPSDLTTIWMNHPLQHAGWKVYQSGFTGDSISMFQVTKDPGLWPMYISCIGLCLGIFIHFYSRSLSSGHPGVPALFENDQNNGSSSI